jgi:hypothetical protein
MKRKTAKQLKETFDKLNKLKISPEDIMFYMLVYMEKIKAEEIGMDLTKENGEAFSVIVSLAPKSIDEITHSKENKCMMVT